MTERDPMYVQAICRTAQEDRLVLAGLVCVEGVESVYDLKVSDGGGLTVNVACGGAFISREDNGTAPCDAQGVYHVFNDATKNLSVSANGTTYIWAQVSDQTYAGASNGWALVSSASSTNPDATHSWYRLATVLAGASTITSVTDDRGLYVSCGGSGPRQIVPYTTVGTTNWNKSDYPGLKAIRVTAIGSGGGSAGAPITGAGQASIGQAGGGGGGAQSILRANSLPDTVVVTVAAAGTAGGAGGAGGAGNPSSFGSLVVAAGGSAGATAGPTTAITSAQGRANPGVGTTGDILVPGQQSDLTVFNANAVSAGWLAPLYAGGSSAWGYGNGGLANGINVNGVAPTQGYGGGGGASGNFASQGTARSGAAGRQGVVIVEIFS